MRRMAWYAIPASAALAVLFVASASLAWSGPTASPPNGNVPAPINVGTNEQTKYGFLTIDNSAYNANSLKAVGNLLLYGPGSNASGSYLNFGNTWGTSGYGIWDNAGTLEFKNSGGSWASLQSTIYNYCSGGGCGGSTPWTTSGSNIYYSGGDVGINTASPRSALEVNGNILNTAAYTANSNLGGYNVGVSTVGANTSVYSYGSICTNNSSGTCNGTGGVVLGSANTSATVNIPSSGNAFFDGGNVGIRTTSPAQALDVNGSIHATQGLFLEDWNTSNGIGQQFFLQNWDGTLYISNSTNYGWTGNRFYLDPSGNGTFSGSVTANGAVYTGDWFRVNGSGGIYWQNYGGGWQMYDSTWIRSYGGKPVYMQGGFDSGSASGVNCGGGLGGGYTFRVCGGQLVTSGLTTQGTAVSLYGGSAEIYANGDNHTGGGIEVADDGGFFDYNDGYITYNGSTGLRIAGNNGPGSSGKLLVQGSAYANAYYYNSDRRLKKNIVSIPSTTALADIMALRPVTYDWKDITMGSGTQLGFIAQEVKQVVPELVSTNASTTMESVDYAKTTPLLVGAVQNQQGQIDALKARLAAQQQEIDTLKADIAQLQGK